MHDLSNTANFFVNLILALIATLTFEFSFFQFQTHQYGDQAGVVLQDNHQINVDAKAMNSEISALRKQLFMSSKRNKRKKQISKLQLLQRNDPVFYEACECVESLFETNSIDSESVVSVQLFDVDDDDQAQRNTDFESTQYLDTASAEKTRIPEDINTENESQAKVKSSEEVATSAPFYAVDDQAEQINKDYAQEESPAKQNPEQESIVSAELFSVQEETPVQRNPESEAAVSEELYSAADNQAESEIIPEQNNNDCEKEKSTVQRNPEPESLVSDEELFSSADSQAQNEIIAEQINKKYTQEDRQAERKSNSGSETANSLDIASEHLAVGQESIREEINNENQSQAKRESNLESAAQCESAPSKNTEKYNAEESPAERESNPKSAATELTAVEKSQNERIPEIINEHAQEESRAQRKSNNPESESAPETFNSSILDNYEIIKQIGEGGYGKVFLAKSIDDGQSCVIKRISLSGLSAQELRYLNLESKVMENMLENMQSSYLIQLIESSVENEELILVMEYAEGGDLYAKIQEHQKSNQYISEEQIVKWITQAALGICDMHSKGILHRDIKDENIFLTADGDIRIGDFGLCHVFDEKTESSRRAHSFVGTEIFMSPERLLNSKEGYDDRADVWALGVILYELLALHHPFDYDNISRKEMIQNTMQGFYKPIPLHYSDEMAILVDRMLERDPEYRYNIIGVLEALERNWSQDDKV
jgi:NIMA (never in mitosis gene a)-related kinase